jgi:hypothetical protein
MGSVYLLFLLFGAALLNKLDDFQKLEPHTHVCKLDKIFKNITHKYDSKKYLGSSYIPYYINSSPTLAILLMLSNDINPNPGPPELQQNLATQEMQAKLHASHLFH